MATAQASKQFYGTGRRKTSCARVYLRPGKGNIVVNELPLDKFFSRETSCMVVRQPLLAVKADTQFDIAITVKGGGASGQAGAIRHGVTRALIAFERATNPSVAKADEESVIVVATAQKESRMLRGQADANVSRLYGQAYSKDSEFYAFMRSLQAYENVFNGKNDMFVVSPDGEFFEFFKSDKAR